MSGNGKRGTRVSQPKANLDLQLILLREFKAKIDAQMDYMREVLEPSAARAYGKAGGRKRREAQQERIKKANELYAYYARRPRRRKWTRQDVCKMVGEDMGLTVGTIAEMVPNPNPERRGRPKK